MNSNTFSTETPVAQLSKVIEALHINQRVVTTRVKFDKKKPQSQPKKISFDGIDYQNEIGSPIDSITVT